MRVLLLGPTGQLGGELQRAAPPRHELMVVPEAELDLRDAAAVQRLLQGVRPALVLNAAAYTHTSVAVRDALLCVAAPVVEVHLSNPDAREPFRRQNLLRDVVAAAVSGFGVDSYRLALRGVHGMLSGGNA